MRYIMISKNCECCSKQIEVRAADIARGWGRFCSKSCAKRKVSHVQKIQYTSNFNRISLIQYLNEKLVYEYDNAKFEKALYMPSLEKAYEYITEYDNKSYFKLI